MFHEGGNEEGEGERARKHIGGEVPGNGSDQAWKGRLEVQPSLSWEQGRAGIKGIF